MAELTLVPGAAGVDLSVGREGDGVFPAARDLRHALALELVQEPEVGLVRVPALVVGEGLRVPEAELALKVAYSTGGRNMSCLLSFRSRSRGARGRRRAPLRRP